MCVYVQGGGEAEVQLVVCIYILTMLKKLITVVLLHKHILAV